MLNKIEDELRVHPEILVDDDVPESCDPSPRHIGHPLPRLRRQRTDSLTNHGEVTKDSVIGHRAELLRVQKALIVLAPADRFKYVGEPLVV